MLLLKNRLSIDLRYWLSHSVYRDAFLGLIKNLTTAYKAIGHVLNIVQLLAGTLGQWSLAVPNVN